MAICLRILLVLVLIMATAIAIGCVKCGNFFALALYTAEAVFGDD